LNFELARARERFEVVGTHSPNRWRCFRALELRASFSTWMETTTLQVLNEQIDQQTSE